MQLNHQSREVTLKVVYYGPGLSGKTTNLQVLHARTRPEVRGELMRVETADDRTLFFDLLPVVFTTSRGYKVKVKVFTVPGQVLHNTTRRIVLQNADAIAFIADSRRSAAQDNNTYWRNMKENMRENGLDPAQVPIIIQFNKRDLPDTKTDAEIDEQRQKGNEVIVGASAIRGEGVLETLHAALQQVYRSLDRRTQFGRSMGLTEIEFLRGVFSTMDLKDTALQSALTGGA